MTTAAQVVLTGLGFILPQGQTTQEVQDFFLQQKNAFVRSVHDPEIAVCPVPWRDQELLPGPCKNARYLSRGQRLCLAAALRALADAQLPTPLPPETGLFLGLGPDLTAKPRQDKALWLLHFLPNTATAVIAHHTGIHGENLTISTACAASTQALQHAYLAIREGRCRLALAGGGDSRLNPEGLAAYKSAGVLATGFSDPAKACRPFDQSRNGFAPGEGSAVFVLENKKDALARKARIYAEVLSAASALDGGALTAPDPQGHTAKRMLDTLLTPLRQSRQKNPHLCVLAHATGTKANDSVESLLIQHLHPAVQSVAALKAHLGHLACACGAAELALALTSLQHGGIPPLPNLHSPCADLPFLREKAPLPTHLLLQNFGFGGQNAGILLEPWI